MKLAVYQQVTHFANCQYPFLFPNSQNEIDFQHRHQGTTMYLVPTQERRDILLPIIKKIGRYITFIDILGANHGTNWARKKTPEDEIFIQVPSISKPCKIISVSTLGSLTLQNLLPSNSSLTSIKASRLSSELLVFMIK